MKLSTPTRDRRDEARAIQVVGECPYVKTRQKHLARRLGCLLFRLYYRFSRLLPNPFKRITPAFGSLFSAVFDGFIAQPWAIVAPRVKIESLGPRPLHPESGTPR